MRLQALTGLHVNVKGFESEPLADAVDVPDRDGIASRLSGRTAEASAGREGGSDGHFCRQIRVEAGLTGTIEQIFEKLMSMYGASRVILASQEIHSERVFVGELMKSSKHSSVGISLAGVRARDAKSYLEAFPGEVCFASIDGDRWKTLATRLQAAILAPVEKLAPISQLRDLQPFQFADGDRVLFGSEWRGRIFLFNPSWRGDKQEELRFLLDLVHQVGPAVYNVYLLHRLRRRAGAAERARFARELHDGAVQSSDRGRNAGGRHSTPVGGRASRLAANWAAFRDCFAKKC